MAVNFVYFHIFRTYDELKYIPGDYLNLIIGPNGTGKSTIVAGIVLGCGGKPALIARSKNVSLQLKIVNK